MANEDYKRMLTAILSADAVGYSRLMREDEEATVHAIVANRAVIAEIILHHHGRVIDSPGDNLLAEFASVVDAINGAIEIQTKIAKRMEFRIGINLGDVIDTMESAMRLNPYYPPWYLGVLGRSYLLLERYDEAILAFENRKKRSKSLLNMVELAIANVLAGKDGPAKEVAMKILKKKPKFTLQKLSMYFQYEDPLTQKRLLTAAQKAGFPR